MPIQMSTTCILWLYNDIPNINSYLCWNNVADQAIHLCIKVYNSYIVDKWSMLCDKNKSRNLKALENMNLL